MCAAALGAAPVVVLIPRRANIAQVDRRRTVAFVRRGRVRLVPLAGIAFDAFD
jgi:hypothetical protein